MSQHELARRVRLRKPTLGLTDADLALGVHVSEETIGRYLRGQSAIPMLNFHRLAEAVGLTVEVGLKDSAVIRPDDSGADRY